MGRKSIKQQIPSILVLPSKMFVGAQGHMVQPYVRISYIVFEYLSIRMICPLFVVDTRGISSYSKYCEFTVVRIK